MRLGLVLLCALMVTWLIGCGGGSTIEETLYSPEFEGAFKDRSSLSEFQTEDVLELIISNPNTPGNVRWIGVCLKHDPGENDPLTAIEVAGYFAQGSGWPVDVDVQWVDYAGTPQMVVIDNFQGAPFNRDERYWVSAVLRSPDGNTTSPACAPFYCKTLPGYVLTSAAEVTVKKDIWGTVYGPDGNPVEGATVAYYHEGQHVRQDATDADGVYEFDVHVPNPHGTSMILETSRGDTSGPTDYYLDATYGGFDVTDVTCYLEHEYVDYNIDMAFNTAPTADLTANPLSGDAPLTVEFDASGSSDPEGYDLEYYWDFDDDGSWDLVTNTPYADHTYVDEDEYDATVLVRDPGFGEDTAFVTIDTAPLQLSWTMLEPMPIPRYAHGLVALGNYVYAVNDGPASTRVDRYDPVTDSWTQVADTIQGRHTNFVTAAEGKIYSCGGYGAGGTTYYGLLECYDPVTDTWTNLNSPMPYPVTLSGHGSGSVYYNGKIYCFGSSEEPPSQRSARLYIYDIATNTWANGQNTPETGSESVVELGGLLYLLGGMTDGPTYRDSVYIYDPATDSYSLDPATLPQPMYDIPVAVYDGRIYALGGRIDTWTFDANVYSWAPGEPSWTDTGVDVASPQATRAARLGDAIYYMGGSNNNGAETDQAQALLFQ